MLVVPKLMINNVLRICHDNSGHIGIEKTIHEIKKLYWFSSMKKIVKKYINNCLSCIFYSPTNKKEGFLKIIDKGKEPFKTIHLDHYGPIKMPSSDRSRYILVIVDAFTKFVKLFPVKTTNSDEVIKHLTNYSCFYSRPERIITDRGSCFTSKNFNNFVENHYIEHVKTASKTPEANGQAERINKTLTPMLAKLSSESTLKWDKLLPKIEYVYNNTHNRSINNCPSVLLFGVQQNNLHSENYNIETFIKNNQQAIENRNIEEIRDRAQKNIRDVQNYNKIVTDKKRIKNTQYRQGDFIVIKNNETNKLSAKFKGPYQIKKVLPNDRYVITDIEGFQVSSVPFNSVYSAHNIRKWMHNNIAKNNWEWF